MQGMGRLILKAARTFHVVMFIYFTQEALLGCQPQPVSTTPNSRKLTKLQSFGITVVLFCTLYGSKPQTPQIQSKDYYGLYLSQRIHVFLTKNNEVLSS